MQWLLFLGLKGVASEKKMCIANNKRILNITRCTQVSCTLYNYQPPEDTTDDLGRIWARMPILKNGVRNEIS